MSKSQEFMRVTVVLKFPVDPELYPGSETPAEWAEAERKNFQDPKILMETAEQFGVESVSVGTFIIEQ